METKNKVVKLAKICHITAKVLYCIACAACLTFIVLAIVLPINKVISSMTAKETAVLFSTLALYAFICIGLLWNIEGLFKSVAAEQTPFTERVSHYLKKIAIFVLVLATVPAIVGSILLHSICPETELSFPVDLGGIIAGIVLFLLGWFFNYGNELQKQDDETL
ncbi:MAG: hypothetical protein J1F69_01335 [Clostridiales bacterium]|nr:hypothetical protein [Clostridiales bacterium]